MPNQHITCTSLDFPGTLIAVAKETLEAINEGTCMNGSSPLVGTLIHEFTEAIRAAPGPVVVDIRDTTLIDHASVSVLVQLARLMAENGGVICCSSSVKAVLDLSGMETVCHTTTDLDEAAEHWLAIEPLLLGGAADLHIGVRYSQ